MLGRDRAVKMSAFRQHLGTVAGAEGSGRQASLGLIPIALGKSRPFPGAGCSIGAPSTCAVLPGELEKGWVALVAGLFQDFFIPPL